MNKLIANEGGQPIYLDDLLLLQSSSFALVQNIVHGLTGEDSGVLLNPLDISNTIAANAETDSDGNATVNTGTRISGVAYHIGANSIIYEGNIIPFEAATFERLLTDIKVGIRIQQTDARTFVDGQTRNCKEMYEAYLYVGDSAEAVASYSLCDMEYLDEVIARRVGLVEPDTTWRVVPMVFYNGYHGCVRYNQSGSIAEIKVNVRSEHTEWTLREEAGLENQFVGLIGVIVDEDCENFIYSGSQLRTSEKKRNYRLRPGRKVLENSTAEILAQSYFSSASGSRELSIKDHYFQNGVEQHVFGHYPPCQSGDAYGEVIAKLYVYPTN